MNIEKVLNDFYASVPVCTQPEPTYRLAYPIASPRHSGAAKARREAKQRRRAK